jgi:hypothetical protein
MEVNQKNMIFLTDTEIMNWKNVNKIKVQIIEK